MSASISHTAIRRVQRRLQSFEANTCSGEAGIWLSVHPSAHALPFYTLNARSLALRKEGYCFIADSELK